MLNIYCGNESINKEKFIFEHIKGRTLLLVPDQFSLQAERDAFFYLDKKGIIDLSIVDFSSLGYKIVKETGGNVPPLIDKYGRHMLLTKIIREQGKELKLYNRMKGKNSFTEMMNTFISEMKRAEITAGRLLEVKEVLEEDNFLKYKLEDIVELYGAYEEAINDKYLDSEDYITFYGNRILNSEAVAKSNVWIYGFDTFTPKNMLVMERLLKTARELNIVMTYEIDRKPGNVYDAAFLAADDRSELFELTGYVIKRLTSMADELNEEVNIKAIDGEPRESVWREKALPVTLAHTSNIYAEADRAAAYILDLVKNGRFRFGDIVVVCNDTELRTGILKRTFMRWGIPVFVDKKRKVLHHPAVGFLLALLEIAALGYRDDAVMRLIKSGIMDFEADSLEALENYVKQFKIKGNMWRSVFTRGGDTYTAEDLNALNGMRAEITHLIDNVKESMGAYNSAGDKIKGLYLFLNEKFFMPRRLEEIMEIQRTGGFEEGAAETAQSWNVICSIFDQIVETIGEERVSGAELLDMMKAGFEEVEIGLVPVNSDTVLIGTLQRTRLSRIKALLVVGANEGLIPLESSDEGLLSEREKNILEGFSLEMVKTDEIMRREESLAIYRTFSQPAEKLYISCSRTNEVGEELRPSEVFCKLMDYRTMHECGEILGDLADEENVLDIINSPFGSISYMTDAFRNYSESGEIDNGWIQVARWYECHEPDDFRRIKKGMFFDNAQEIIGEEFADALYRGDRKKLEVSASRLEKYSSCPFAHFVLYGLRPDEMRTFEMGAREIGDIYHECIMKLSEKFTREAENRGINNPESPWMTVSYEECRQEIKRILREDIREYREGLMFSGKNEEYRAERITDICSRAAWSLIRQIRKGHIRDMYFERPFANGESLPAVKIDVGGKEVIIKGKIDRMDILNVRSFDKEIPDYEAVRIVDYKTGGEAVDVDYYRKGYKLQLMIYMKAAMQKEEKPAGVFLFKIREVDSDADLTSVKPGDEAAQERIENAYRLQGIVLDDADVIGAMDEEFDGSSQVIPVKHVKKDGSYAPSAGGYLFSPEEFEELSQQVDIQLERICREICDGKIDVAPKKERVKDMEGSFRDSCKYCGYKSICMFDTAFEGCHFSWV